MKFQKGKLFPFFINKHENGGLVWGKLFSEVSGGSNPNDLRLPDYLNNELLIDYLNILKDYGLEIGLQKISRADIRCHKTALAIAGIFPRAINKFINEEGMDVLFSNSTSLSGLLFKSKKDLRKRNLWSGIERINSFYPLVVDTLIKEGIQFDSPFLFAEMPLLELNAEARKTKSGYIFLINEGLISFLLIFSFLFIASYQHYINDMENPKRPSNHNAMYAIFHLVIEYSKNQRIPDLIYLLDLANFRFLQPEYSLRAKRTFLTIIKFIVFHEIAHGYLGHLNKNETTTTAMSRQLGQPFNIIKKSLEEEDEADLLATKLAILDGESYSFKLGSDLVNLTEGDHPLSRIMAIGSYLQIMSFLDESYDYLHDKERWKEIQRIRKEKIIRDDCSIGTTHRHPADRLGKFIANVNVLANQSFDIGSDWITMKGLAGVMLQGYFKWNNLMVRQWQFNFEALINNTD